MVLNYNLNEISLVISGINIVVSIFLFIISVKVSKKGFRFGKYLATFFILIFLDSIYIAFTYFDFTELSQYGQPLLEITVMVVMLLLYTGIVRGTGN